MLKEGTSESKVSVMMVEDNSTIEKSDDEGGPFSFNFYEDASAERLQCVDEDSINFLISSAVADRNRHYKPDMAETEAVRQQIIQLSEKGYGPVAISRILGISRQRASRWIRRHEAEETQNEIQLVTPVDQGSSQCEENAPPYKASNNATNPVEELQCIDQDSIEVLTSLFNSDKTPATLFSEITHDSVTRSQIIDLHKEGHGPTAIARELGITRQTAARWVKRYMQEGSLKTKMRVGRPRKLTTEQKVLIQQYVIEKPYVTITEVKRKFHLSCSRSTVWGIMKNPQES